MTEAGAVKFYVDAEAVLERLPRLGVPLILKARRRDGAVGSYRPNHMAKLVRKLADKFGMPATFTLDACRHGGMTELEEAELTTGQGRAGQGRAGQGRAGQGRAGQGRAGQGRAGHYLAIEPTEPIPGMPRRRWSAPWRPPGSVTPIGWRTKTAHPFRMAGRI
jgi:hypothetical protein